MKRSTRRHPRGRNRVALLGIGALALIGVSFGVASGTIIDTGNSLVASVAAAISGRPTVLIGRDAASPSGRVPMGVNSTLAVYDIKATNVTHWASVKYLALNFSITAASTAPLSFKDTALSYHYCIPVGVTYGYGYKSAGCGSMKLVPSYIARNGNVYMVSFNTGVPIYPQQSSGTLTIYSTPLYTYTKDAKRLDANDAQLRVKVTNAVAVGDQCQWTRVSAYGYGYTGCVSYGAIINLWSPYGNQLTVTRAYGYGYAGARSNSSKPNLTFQSLSGSNVSVTYANLPPNSSIVLVNQTSGQVTPLIQNRSGTGSVTIIISGVAAGTYYLKAIDPSGAYLAQTVSFTYAGNTSTPMITIASSYLNMSISSGSSFTIGGSTNLNTVRLEIGKTANFADVDALYDSVSTPVDADTGKWVLTVPAGILTSSGTYYIDVGGVKGSGVSSQASTQITVSGGTTGPSVSVSPSSVAAGGSVTVSWSEVHTGVFTWIALLRQGDPPTQDSLKTTGWTWAYLSCAKTVGSSPVSGSCPFSIPSSLASGSYVFQLFGDGTYGDPTIQSPSFTVNAVQ